MNEQTESVRIDVFKLKARSAELAVIIREKRQTIRATQRAMARKGKLCYLSCDSLRHLQEEVTKLYALRAHLRGRLHITRTKHFNARGKVEYTYWTLDSQKLYVDDIIKDYTLSA